MLVQLEQGQIGDPLDICDTISTLMNVIPNYMYNNPQLIVSLMSLSAILCKERKISSEDYQDAAFVISESILTEVHSF